MPYLNKLLIANSCGPDISLSFKDFYYMTSHYSYELNSPNYSPGSMYFPPSKLITSATMPSIHLYWRACFTFSLPSSSFLSLCIHSLPYCCCSLFVIPWTVARLASLSFTISPSLPKYMSNEMVILSNYGILWCCLIILPSLFPSLRVFSSESAVQIRWLKFWSFSFSINSSNEYSRLISFRMDWFDLIEVQGTLKSLLQYHNSKTSLLWYSAFVMVQLSHLHMTTGKTIALTVCTFVGKVMSLLFKTLSRFP